MNTFQTRVSLRVFGPNFDPAKLSQELGMEPKHSHKAGEARITPKGTPLDGIYPSSYCSFPINQADSEELSAVLGRIVQTLIPHKAVFEGIRSDGGRIELFIGWYSAGNSGDTFTSDMLSTLGDLKIDLALDVYGSDAPALSA